MERKKIKSAFGLTFSKNFIFDRVLDIIPILCWKSEDIGLTREHDVCDLKFTSMKKAEEYARQNNIPVKNITSHFNWVDAVGDREGVERENFLKDEYWPKREQVMNIMLDSVLQFHINAVKTLLSGFLQIEVGSLEMITVNTKNIVRRYSGQPDTVFIDEENKNLIFIEIKIGNSSTQYTLDQHVKYIGLNALSSLDELFPDYKIHNILLAPREEFLANTTGFKSLDPHMNDGNEVTFNYEKADVKELKPIGCKNIYSLVNKRLNNLGLNSKELNNKHIDTFSLKFMSWSNFYELVNDNRLKESLTPLMPYLTGD